ncbi:hypothetical protein [Streptomyces sp. NPDC000931]|uniref:hypothetical protein n=1 Tax=Streptomyces sp. NPDC000931 TaxID=3154372 RepID=UPI00332E2166
MARTTRRHVSRAVSASVVAAALAFPVSLTTASAASHTGDGIAVGIPAQTTPPPPDPTTEPSPPEPPPTEPDAPSDETEPSEPSTPPDETEPTEPGDSPTSEGEEQDGTPDEDQSTASGEESDRTTTEPTVEQKEEIEEVTEVLTQETEEAPEELTPSVAQLTTVLQAAEKQETPPQEREGVIRSAKQIAAALEVINDSRTPPEVRKVLIVIVKQMVSALNSVSTAEVSPEERSTIVLTVQRCTSVLDLISDPSTPRELRDHLANTIKQLYRVLMWSTGAKPVPDKSAAPGGISAAQQSRQDAATIGVALETAGRSETSDGDRHGLAETADEASSSLQDSSDPRVSDEDRKEARREAEERLARLNEQMKKAAFAQGLPDVPLGEAAEVCTNAIFKSVPDNALVRGIEELSPARWETEGVKDYWKAKESGSDSLDVQAQLRNNKYDSAPFEVAPLVTGLAGVVPAGRLFGTVGIPGLHCLQSARQLDHQGVEVETWLQMVEEEA